jgi:hypothetical protein
MMEAYKVLTWRTQQDYAKGIRENSDIFPSLDAALQYAEKQWADGCYHVTIYQNIVEQTWRKLN